MATCLPYFWGDLEHAGMLEDPRMPGSHSRSLPSSRHEWFVTTHWSVVLAAGRKDSQRARDALESLCQAYWYPLYAFVRRLGHGPHDAEDLVQAFFAQCLAKNYLGAADQSKGRFRSFLLLAFKRFLANEWDRKRARKRGGAIPALSLDSLTAEQRYALEPTDQLTADRLFERRWAMTLLENVLTKLRAEQVEAGRAETFAALQDCLTGDGRSSGYQHLAKRIGISEGAVKIAVHRLRRRYRELLQEEIANTVGSPEEVDDERRYLLSVISQ
jgi:RNA polymerase sigma-70 factor (ECF subfamily)